MKKYIGLVIFLFFCISDIVLADECTYAMKASLSKEALSVSASYSIETTSDGTQYFKISVYNITPNIYVAYTDENDKTYTIAYSETTNGVYSFDDFNTSSIFKYVFSVKSELGKTGCSYKILSTYLVRPKKNSYASMDECKYEKMKDYHYCQEWISTEFLVDDSVIIKNIKEKANATSTTTVISSTDSGSDYLTFTELYLMIRNYLIIGLAIGIVLDIVFIYKAIRKVRESSL